MTETTKSPAKPQELQIIGAGFGRTGTLSLKVALETLGFGPCYHMTELFKHPDDSKTWVDAAQGKPTDWRALFSDYRATVDWPGCSFYTELMEAYPNARVLLTVRDPERWYESVQNTIFRASTPPASPFERLVFSLMRTMAPPIRAIGRTSQEIVWKKQFHGRFAEKAYAIEIFNQHNEAVRRAVPPEKLLVFDVKEGWGPLCAFLGVPVPTNTPFPHLNDQANFAGVRIRRRIQRIVTGALAALGALVIGALLFRGMRKKQRGH